MLQQLEDCRQKVSYVCTCNPLLDLASVSIRQLQSMHWRDRLFEPHIQTYQVAQQLTLCTLLCIVAEWAQARQPGNEPTQGMPKM